MHRGGMFLLLRLTYPDGTEMTFPVLVLVGWVNLDNLVVPLLIK